VTRRTLVLVSLGLLLPLPLVLLLRSLWAPPLPAREVILTASGALEISPVLSVEERRGVLTFERPCSRQEDCEPPLGCLSFNGKEGFCAASRCLTDLQCSGGQTCRVLPTLGQGPRVRACAPAGQLPEGVPCLALTMNEKESCARGLVCNGFCGRPCSPEAAAPCPEGFFCALGPSGPACAPTCEGHECPADQQCVRFARGVSRCAAPVGDDCQRSPCPQGQQCTASFTPGRAHWAKLECELPCDSSEKRCPEGLLCHQGSCRRPCQPKGPEVCGAGRACNTLNSEEEGSWLCGIAGG
jgi:hypothetical protein